MKVGTDGVTLGALAPAAGRVLDVGCGCGLVGLMLAQRGAASVVMIEIDPAAANEAAINAAASPWSDRINTVCADFLNPESCVGPFDSIVSNPPFFASGLLAPDLRRASARHDNAMPPAAFMCRAAELLAPGGTLCIIVPTDCFDRWNLAALKASLHLQSLTRLQTKPGAAPKRVVALFSATHNLTPPSHHTLAMDSDDYMTITSPFYL